MNQKNDPGLNFDHAISRRKFISASAIGGVALIAERFTSCLHADPVDPIFIEATIPELQDMMASGQLTSRQLILGYIDRIKSLNPLLHSVIEVNPNAISIADQLDNERR